MEDMSLSPLTELKLLREPAREAHEALPEAAERGARTLHRDDPEVLSLNAPVTNDQAEQSFTEALADEIGSGGIELAADVVDELGLAEITGALPDAARAEFNQIMMAELDQGATAFEAASSAIQEMITRSPEMVEMLADVAEHLGVDPELLIAQFEQADAGDIARNAEAVFKGAAKAIAA